MSLLRRMILPALASVVFFVSCQKLSGHERGPTAEDSLRVELHLGAGQDTLVDSLRTKARWLRIQFATTSTDTPLSVDTILSLPASGWVSPAFPKVRGYSATVSGLDADRRKLWGGGATRHAVGDTVQGGVTVPLAVPLQAQEPLPVDSVSLPSGLLDFPRPLRFPLKVAEGTLRVCSFDSLHWTPCPKRIRVDSSMRLLVQTRSVDSLTGAPFSPILRLQWGGKPVQAPTWKLKRCDDLPGAPMRVYLRTATRGARIEWSADTGRTWKRYGGRFRIRSGKLYQARAVKKHQGESPVVQFALRRTVRGLVLVAPDSAGVPGRPATGAVLADSAGLRKGGGAASLGAGRMPRGNRLDSAAHVPPPLR